MAFDPAVFGAALSRAFNRVGDTLQEDALRKLAQEREDSLYQTRREDELEDYRKKLEIDLEFMGKGLGGGRRGRGGGGGGGRGGRGRMPSPFDMAVSMAQQQMALTEQDRLQREAKTPESSWYDVGPTFAKRMAANQGYAPQALASVPSSEDIKYQTAADKFIGGQSNPLRTFILRDKFSSPGKVQSYINRGMLNAADVTEAKDAGILTDDEANDILNAL